MSSAVASSPLNATDSTRPNSSLQSNNNNNSRSNSSYKSYRNSYGKGSYRPTTSTKPAVHPDIAALLPHERKQFDRVKEIKPHMHWETVIEFCREHEFDEAKINETIQAEFDGKINEWKEIPKKHKHQQSNVGSTTTPTNNNQKESKTSNDRKTLGERQNSMNFNKQQSNKSKSSSGKKDVDKDKQQNGIKGAPKPKKPEPKPAALQTPVAGKSYAASLAIKPPAPKPIKKSENDQKVAVDENTAPNTNTDTKGPKPVDVSQPVQSGPTAAAIVAGKAKAPLKEKSPVRPISTASSETVSSQSTPQAPVTKKWKVKAKEQTPPQVEKPAPVQEVEAKEEIRSPSPAKIQPVAEVVPPTALKTATPSKLSTSSLNAQQTSSPIKQQVSSPPAVSNQTSTPQLHPSVSDLFASVSLQKEPVVLPRHLAEASSALETEVQFGRPAIGGPKPKAAGSEKMQQSFKTPSAIGEPASSTRFPASEQPDLLSSQFALGSMASPSNSDFPASETTNQLQNENSHTVHSSLNAHAYPAQTELSSYDSTNTFDYGNTTLNMYPSYDLQRPRQSSNSQSSSINRPLDTKAAATIPPAQKKFPTSSPQQQQSQPSTQSNRPSSSFNGPTQRPNANAPNTAQSQLSGGNSTSAAPQRYGTSATQQPSYNSFAPQQYSASSYPQGGQKMGPADMQFPSSQPKPTNYNAPKTQYSKQQHISMPYHPYGTAAMSAYPSQYNMSYPYIQPSAAYYAATGPHQYQTPPGLSSAAATHQQLRAGIPPYTYNYSSFPYPPQQQNFEGAGDLYGTHNQMPQSLNDYNKYQPHSQQNEMNQGGQQPQQQQPIGIVGNETFGASPQTQNESWQQGLKPLNKTVGDSNVQPSNPQSIVDPTLGGAGRTYNSHPYGNSQFGGGQPNPHNPNPHSISSSSYYSQHSQQTPYNPHSQQMNYEQHRQSFANQGWAPQA